MNRGSLALALLLTQGPPGWAAASVEIPEAVKTTPAASLSQPGVSIIELPTAPLTPAAGLAELAPTQIQTVDSPAATELPTPVTMAPTPTARAEAPLASPAAAEPSVEAPTTGFGARVRAVLSRIKNPFGSIQEPQEAPVQTPEQEGYAQFQEKDYWSSTAESTRAEISRLRTLKSKSDVQDYVRKAGQEIVSEIGRRRGTANIGFHFNLHGGTAQGYVDGGGIRATMGDIANNYSMHGDKNLKVYFFQSKNVQLYDILNEKNPALLFFPSRMGSVLSLFRLDAAELTQAEADGRIKNFGAISMDFHGMRGVPYSAFLTPPLDVFHQTAKRIGVKGRLSRDEETLAVMRYLEAAALSADNFVSLPPR